MVVAVRKMGMASSGSVPQTDLEAEVFRCLEELKKVSEKDFRADVQNPSVFSKSYWLTKTAEAAEIAGWPKTEIASKVLDLVDKHEIKIGKAWIYEVLSPLGYSDSPLNGQQDSSSPPSGQEDSSSDSTACESENHLLIEQMEKDIKNKQEQVKKLKARHFLSLMPQEEQRELLMLYVKHNKNTAAEWDGRQDVSERQFFMLYMASTMAINDKATQAYIQYVKDWQPLTGKQWTKLMHGRATMLPPLFDPKSRKEAVELGFYGVQCNGCGSWRVSPTPEPTRRMVVHCFACKADFEPETVALPINKGIVIDAAKVL